MISPSIIYISLLALHILLILYLIRHISTKKIVSLPVILYTKNSYTRCAVLHLMSTLQIRKSREPPTPPPERGAPLPLKFEDRRRLVIPVRCNEAAEPLGARRLDEGRDIVVPHVVDAAVRIRATAENGCEVGDPLVTSTRSTPTRRRRTGARLSHNMFSRFFLESHGTRPS